MQQSSTALSAPSQPSPPLTAPLSFSAPGACPAATTPKKRFPLVNQPGYSQSAADAAATTKPKGSHSKYQENSINKSEENKIEYKKGDAKKEKDEKWIGEPEAFCNGGAIPPFRMPDPKIPLGKNSPAPCNSFYLRADGCRKMGYCPFSHNYILNSKQLGQLRTNAKTSPCYTVLKNRPCEDPYCVLAHVCPFGATCKWGPSCRFKGRGMHPSPNDPEAHEVYKKRAARDLLDKSMEGVAKVVGSRDDDWEDEN